MTDQQELKLDNILNRVIEIEKSGAVNDYRLKVNDLEMEEHQSRMDLLQTQINKNQFDMQDNHAKYNADKNKVYGISLGGSAIIGFFAWLIKGH